MEERTHSSLSRKQHFQFLPEPRSEIDRHQQCERCRSLSCKELPAIGERGWQSSALVSPTKTLSRDVAPIGDDTEPVGKSRADVEMGNEEDEEPLEAEIPRVRMNPKNPASREKQEHEDSGHAVCKSWCAACVESRRVGGKHRVELLEEERERTTAIVAFDYGFDFLRQQVWSNGSDMLRTEKYHSKLHFISCWFHQRSWFAQNHFEMR